ncbi:NAD(P)/FAD-dependent oxidoreductase [Candidatus Marimicrobium litorale]|uniref:FAD-dependent oxidoreductase n=1 Tax=Candidatus Marimicrobium litorale TaxID=2518991 RepID=A0ABT3T4H0_9GAMM|nr:FAD-dependent oxidoreductase [Candidatus Marimicrobium litorale]MCX2976969.1 FAD-dependent oxidoreductase [Candidatus Marimicrobium litorale]
MKIAVIGSGISGLASAHYLSASHDVSVFEANKRIGGHTATMDVELGTRRYAIDTGFIVFNDWTYPNFIALLDELGVASTPTEMGFSVADPETGLEYSGASLNTLFAQRSNLFSASFIKMVRDILRFNRESVAELDSGVLDNEETLGRYLARHGYGEKFTRQYLAAMGSAIWSSDATTILDFPLVFFLRFFKNHGLLSVANRPQWRVITGGSREYLAPLCARFSERLYADTAVASVQRSAAGVTLQLEDGRALPFDQVVIATHSDQALRLLEEPTAAESELLAAIPYQANDVVLHTDTRVLPKNRKTWSSWNYRLGGAEQRSVVTYNMNILQGIKAPETFCVTLNNTDEINPHRILGHFSYDHPVFSRESLAAQQRWGEINGVSNTWYCGAYWHNGFHEDGVVSALRVANAIEDSQRAAA